MKFVLNQTILKTCWRIRYHSNFKEINEMEIRSVLIFHDLIDDLTAIVSDFFEARRYFIILVSIDTIWQINFII